MQDGGGDIDRINEVLLLPLFLFVMFSDDLLFPLLYKVVERGHLHLDGPVLRRASSNTRTLVA